MATFDDVAGSKARRDNPELLRLKPEPPYIAAAMIELDLAAGYIPDTVAGSFEHLLAVLEQTTPVDEKIAARLANHLEALTRTNWQQVYKNMKRLEEDLAKGILVRLALPGSEVVWPKLNGEVMTVTLVATRNVTMCTMANKKPIKL